MNLNKVSRIYYRLRVRILRLFKRKQQQPSYQSKMYQQDYNY